MKKRLLAVLGLFAICKIVHSQTIVYEYDEAGNRVYAIKKVTRSISDNYEEDLEKSLTAVNLTVTDDKGKITIFIKELDQENPYEASLYATNGILMFSKTLDTNTTTISLSDYPTGTYVLTIKYKEETSTYKFAKK